MKVMSNVKNMMIQELQQSMESQLIEVMNLKMTHKPESDGSCVQETRLMRESRSKQYHP
jgi:hypothetical protein